MLILIGAAGVTLAGTSAALLFRSQPDATQKEMQRLLILHQRGRIAHGDLDEVHGQTVFYSYEVSGVSYTAAQDLSLFPLLTEDRLRMLTGQVNIKFHRANPSNSMVHSDHWSGLGLPAQTTHDSSLRRVPQ